MGLHAFSSPPSFPLVRILPQSLTLHAPTTPPPPPSKHTQTSKHFLPLLFYLSTPDINPVFDTHDLQKGSVIIVWVRDITLCSTVSELAFIGLSPETERHSLKYLWRHQKIWLEWRSISEATYSSTSVMKRQECSAILHQMSSNIRCSSCTLLLKCIVTLKYRRTKNKKEVAIQSHVKCMIVFLFVCSVYFFSWHMCMIIHSGRCMLSVCFYFLQLTAFHVVHSFSLVCWCFTWLIYFHVWFHVSATEQRWSHIVCMMSHGLGNTMVVKALGGLQWLIVKSTK